MLVGEDAVKNQKLFAGCVFVTGKRAARGISDNAGGARNLIADSVEHDSVDP